VRERKLRIRDGTQWLLCRRAPHVAHRVTYRVSRRGVQVCESNDSFDVCDDGMELGDVVKAV
jgi:hypothetical protein